MYMLVHRASEAYWLHLLKLFTQKSTPSHSSTRDRGRSMPPGGSIHVLQTKFARHMRTRMHRMQRRRDGRNGQTSCEDCVRIRLAEGNEKE